MGREINLLLDFPGQVVQAFQQCFEFEFRLPELLGDALAPDAYLAKRHFRFIDLVASRIDSLLDLHAVLVELPQFVIHVFDLAPTLYALAVLAAPITADTGWSSSIVFGGLTVGLLVSGAISAWTGWVIDSKGARLVMTVGSVLNAVGLVALVTMMVATAILWGYGFAPQFVD